jgi:serine/threonine protein kinase
MPANLEKARELFLHAVGQLPPEQWDDYVATACAGDAELEQQLRRYLQVHCDAGSFLEAPAPGLVATVDAPVSEGLGTVIGPYKLLEVIGEGGFGVVYMAEQTQPVRRKVALKVLKPGMDTRQVVARFEAERQALALMDHPNIAHVLDAGETTARRPYFVMDLVRGIPITDFCDQAQLSPKDRLQLFISVCQAVQHAHQKGIIHRDLKPSNILVTLHDDRSVVKVIDFGVAKALGQQLTDKTLFTGFAQMIGTPLYMSPEQAQMTALDVDTRSDIYSLGVLLYELLTGTTPFQKERLKSVSFDEIRRIIREEEPPKPSTRISTLGQGATTLSARRHTDPHRLRQLLRGELDWIVMKCLEKDRNRRYETANALAADVDRYLHDEPVEAGPPSTWYRLQKFAQRNKAALLTAAIVLLTVVAGLTISTLMIAQERDKAQAAAQEAQEQRAAAVRQSTLAGIKAEEAEKERKRAETNFNRTREAVDRFFTRAAVEMENKPHMERVRRALLEDALKFYQGFLEEKSADPIIRHETALAYVRVAQAQDWLGNTAQAEAPARSAIALFKQLSTEHSDNKEYRQDLAEAHDALADSLDYQIRIEDALAEYRKALAIWEHLAADFPAVAIYRRGIANGHGNLGKVLTRLWRQEEAEIECRRALALWDEIQREFPNEPKHGLATLAGLLMRSNRWQDAEHAYRQAVQGEGFSDWDRLGLAQVLLNTGRPREAEAIIQQALPEAERLADDFPNARDYRLRLWWIHSVQGSALFAMNRIKDAQLAYQRSVTVLEKMLADQPREVKLMNNLGVTYFNLGCALNSTNRFAEATDAFRRVLELWEKAVAANPQGPAPLMNLAGFLADCPAPQFRDPARAIELSKRVLQRWPSGLGWSAYGSALYRAGKWTEAIEAWQKAMELGNGGSVSEWFSLAMAHWQRGDPKEARKWYDKACAGMQKYPSGDVVSDHLRQTEAAALLGVAKPKPRDEAEPPGKR